MQGQAAGPPCGKPDQSLPRRKRLTRSSEFKETYEQGRRFVGRTMVLWLREGEETDLRLGVVASRKVGNAVARARAKRRMREAFRRHRHAMQGESDVVLVARKAILTAPWETIVEELLNLAKKAGLLI